MIMADSSAAEDDIITLVTSNDPPFELPVERELLRDSRVFSDMFSLPTTSDGDARLNVAETAYELGLWIDFLRSGQVETPDPDAWDHDTDQEVGQDVVRIAKLVDKYVCTSSRHLFVNELWHVVRISITLQHLQLQADKSRSGAFSPREALIRSLLYSQATTSKRTMFNDMRQWKRWHAARGREPCGKNSTSARMLILSSGKLEW